MSITCDFSIAALYLQPFLRLHAVWTVNAAGDIRLSLDGKRDPIFPFLPRFGLRFSLPLPSDSPSLDSLAGKEYGTAGSPVNGGSPETEADGSGMEVTYFGYGPHESYCDKHRASYMDVFRTTVGEMHEDYIRPRENGSRFHCHYAAVGTFRAQGRAPFSFNVSEYTIEELASKAHNYELEKADCLTVCTDYKMSGVGSNSCGPQLLPQYQLNDPAFDFNFTLTVE